MKLENSHIFTTNKFVADLIVLPLIVYRSEHKIIIF